MTSSTAVTGTPSVADARRGRAGRDDLDAGLVQAAGELVEAGLVVDADERAADGDLGHENSWQSVGEGGDVERFLGGLDAGAQRVLVVAGLDRHRAPAR